MHFAVTALLAVTACNRGAGAPKFANEADSVRRARQDSINRTQPGYVVDSILPADEALRRFRTATGGPAVTRLHGGAASRAELIERWVRAVARADTSALRAMAVSAREFGDLYYLESPYSRPPYRQPPELAWRLLQSPSATGLARTLKVLGGHQLAYLSHTCGASPAREGKTLRHSGCVVTIRDGAEVRAPQQYFGSIVERNGQFKFLSFSRR